MKVGGLDINADPTQDRIQGDPESIANVYRTGLVNEANHLDEVAIINHGGPDPGIAHDYAHAFWTEERLQRDQGHTDNRVMWFGETPLIGDVRWATEAFLAMDRWLSAVEADQRAVPLSTKIVEDRPEDITDRCENVPGVNMLTLPGGDVVCEQPTLQTRLSTPREVAGDDVANDRVACRAAAARPGGVRPARADRRAVRDFAAGLPRRRATGASPTGAGPGRDLADLRRRGRCRRARRPQPAGGTRGVRHRLGGTSFRELLEQ